MMQFVSGMYIMVLLRSLRRFRLISSHQQLLIVSGLGVRQLIFLVLLRIFNMQVLLQMYLVTIQLYLTFKNQRIRDMLLFIISSMMDQLLKRLKLMILTGLDSKLSHIQQIVLVTALLQQIVDNLINQHHIVSITLLMLLKILQSKNQ